MFIYDHSLSWQASSFASNTVTTSYLPIIIYEEIISTKSLQTLFDHFIVLDLLPKCLSLPHWSFCHHCHCHPCCHPPTNSNLPPKQTLTLLPRVSCCASSSTVPHKCSLSSYCIIATSSTSARPLPWHNGLCWFLICGALGSLEPWLLAVKYIFDDSCFQTC